MAHTQDWPSAVGQHVNVGLCALDNKRRFVYANPSAEELLGRRLPALLGVEFSTIIHHAHAGSTDGNGCAFHAPPQGARGCRGDTDEVTANGSRVPIETVLSPILTGDKAIGFACAIWPRSVQATRRAGAQSRVVHTQPEFIGLVTHRIGSPLSGIIFALESVAKRITGDTDLDRVRERIRRNITQIQNILADMSDLAFVASKRVDLKKGRVDLAAIVRRACDNAQTLLQERQHEITRAIEPGLFAEMDSVRIEQALTHLLDNAAKYMKPGGRIQVIATRQDSDADLGVETVVVTVKDTGMGISPELLPEIFEWFTQVAGIDELPRPKGAGIGLAFVRHVVELHGGRVLARSAGEGHGCEFLMKLPVKSPARDPRLSRHR